MGAKSVWELSAKQHGVITRSQLLGLGLSASAIHHRLAKGRLHRIHRGVYALGRPQLDERGEWMAAVLACGSGAVLSHRSAAALWKVIPVNPRPIEVSVPANSSGRRPGVVAHRTRLSDDEVARHKGIPVTAPARTLIDIAGGLTTAQLERAINEADKLDLIDVQSLRMTLKGRTRGTRVLRQLLDSRTFVLTDSELERRFLRIATKAALPKPLTGALVGGFRADFYWPALGLVVETDGLRYHRTPAQQAKDRERDQAYAIAGLTPLRFTHAQIAFQQGKVIDTLKAVAARLAGRQ